MSVEHEVERKRLEGEQRAAAEQSDAARKRNWQLLEEKGDLELSVHHVKEIAANDPLASRHLGDWGQALKGVSQLEQSLSEHQTVVQVRQ